MNSNHQILSTQIHADKKKTKIPMLLLLILSKAFVLYWFTLPEYYLEVFSIQTFFLAGVLIWVLGDILTFNAMKRRGVLLRISDAFIVGVGLFIAIWIIFGHALYALAIGFSHSSRVFIENIIFLVIATVIVCVLMSLFTAVTFKIMKKITK